MFINFNSFLVCTAYRPSNTRLDCFDSDLSNTLHVVSALSLSLPFNILGDLNCSLQDPAAQSLVKFGSFSIIYNKLIVAQGELQGQRNHWFKCRVGLKCWFRKGNKSFPFLCKRPWTNPSCFEREKEPSQATRSYKKNKPETFIRDHLKAPWRIIETFEDVDDCLHAFHQLFEQILDQHAPVRKVKIRCCPNPFITPENEYATWWSENKR